MCLVLIILLMMLCNNTYYFVCLTCWSQHQTQHQSPNKPESHDSHNDAHHNHMTHQFILHGLIKLNFPLCNNEILNSFFSLYIVFFIFWCSSNFIIFLYNFCIRLNVVNNVVLVTIMLDKARLRLTDDFEFIETW